MNGYQIRDALRAILAQPETPVLMALAALDPEEVRQLRRLLSQLP